MNWQGVVADLVLDLGWTRDEVLDQIDWPFYRVLCERWQDAPPLRVMVARYIGYKPKTKARSSKAFAEALKESQSLAADFPDGIIR